jgi:hypothetical protein
LGAPLKRTVLEVGIIEGELHGQGEAAEDRSQIHCTFLFFREVETNVVY